MYDLLSHFSPDVTILPVESYQAGMVEDHDAVVFLGLWEGAALGDSFPADCLQTTKPVCWLGANVRRIATASSPNRLGFLVEDPKPATGPTRIVYRATAFRRNPTPLPRLTIVEPKLCRAVALVGAGGEQLPYAVRAGRFLYFPETPPSPAETGPYLVLSDQLHSLLGDPHAVERTALVLIRGVTPETEAGPLADQVRNLQALGLPFALEVQPFGRRGLPLSRRRALVSALRGAQRAGASIVASVPPHLVIRARGASNPLPTATEKTLLELSRCGLYPLAWSLPGDACAEADLSAAAPAFSTVLARPSDGQEKSDAVSPLPFVIPDTGHGLRIMPGASLVLTEGHGQVEEILDSARRRALLPDPWTTIAISPTAPADAVALLVNSLRDLRYEPLDLRYTTNRTRTEALQVYSVQAQHYLSELVEEGWDALVVGPSTGQTRKVTGADRDEALVRPGAIVVAFPSGRRPDVVFSFEGDPQQMAQRTVYAIARIIAFFALFAIAILTLIYLAQILQRRGA